MDPRLDDHGPAPAGQRRFGRLFGMRDREACGLGGTGECQLVKGPLDDLVRRVGDNRRGELVPAARQHEQAHVVVAEDDLVVALPHGGSGVAAAGRKFMRGTVDCRPRMSILAHTADSRPRFRTEVHALGGSFFPGLQGRPVTPRQGAA